MAAQPAQCGDFQSECQPAQIDSCGRCHSGSARSSLIAGQKPLVGDANMGIICTTCHDPHQTNGYPAQLRYPVASTNDYFMPTNGVFASSFNPKINVCGQCHNDTGASWTNNAGPPHYSAQYNMLLGTDGTLVSGLPPYQPGSHAILLTNQCVECHMQTTPFVSRAVPAVTGHKFTVDSYNVCLQCHPFPELLAQFTQGSISNQVQQLKLDLDYWAENKGTGGAVEQIWQPGLGIQHARPSCRPAGPGRTRPSRRKFLSIFKKPGSTSMWCSAMAAWAFIIPNIA